MSDDQYSDKEDVAPMTSTRAPIPQTRGLRKSSVAIVVACVGLVILFALMEVFKQADPGRHGEDETKNAPSKMVTPESIMDLPSDYSKIPGPDDAPVIIQVGPDGRDTIRKDGQGRPIDADGKPIFSTRDQMRIRALEDQKKYEDELEREIRLSELREREKAFASAIFFPPSSSPQPGASGGGPQASGSSNKDLIDALKANAEPDPRDPNQIIPLNVRQNLQTEKILFSSESKDQEPYVQNPFLKPLSPYVVQAGTVIPGALVTAINTDLPGECTAVVTRNVYDSPTGEYLLVPVGSRLFGVYSSLVSNGQNRAQIAWNRIILPNGRSISIGNMPATDKKGQAGLKDLVDYHWDSVAMAVGITTGIAYAGNLARDQNNPNSDRDFIGDTVAQESARVGQKIVERELDVQPTITIRSGWPLRLMVNKDLILEPYVQ